MSIDQVVTGQIHRGVMHGVNEVGLHHGVVGVLHRIGRVNHIYLQKKQQKQYCIFLLYRLVCTIQALVCVLQLCSHSEQTSYLHLEVIADISTVELRADQSEFPVKQSLCVPVFISDKVQELLVVGHGVHP